MGRNHQSCNSYQSIYPSDCDLSSSSSSVCTHNIIATSDDDDGESKLHHVKFTTSTEMFIFKMFRAARMGWDSIATTPGATVSNRSAPIDADDDDDDDMLKNKGRRRKSLLIYFLIAVTIVMVSSLYLPSMGLSTIPPSMKGLTRNEIIAQKEADIQQKLLLDDDNDDNEDIDEKEKEFKTLPLLASHKRKHKKAKNTKAPKEEKTIKLKVPPGCEGTVIIIRHCEKGVIREHCDYLGYERAAFLATQFGDNDEDRWPSPSYIFSLNPGGRHHEKKVNVREIETIEPLADKFNLTAEVSYREDQANLLAHEVIKLIKSGELCGRVALISWKHSEIPHLTTKLGCGPKDGCPADYPSSTFDMTVQIKYAYGKLLHSDNKQGKVDRHYQWFIYGSTVYEGFDPLKFSKKSGDYVRGGTEIGARWMLDVDFIEMKKGNTLVKKKPSMVSRIEGGIE